MLVIKNITIRNFLSIGQVTQAINFDSKDLTLVLGENTSKGEKCSVTLEQLLKDIEKYNKK